MNIIFEKIIIFFTEVVAKNILRGFNKLLELIGAFIKVLPQIVNNLIEMFKQF